MAVFYPLQICDVAEVGVKPGKYTLCNVFRNASILSVIDPVQGIRLTLSLVGIFSPKDVSGAIAEPAKSAAQKSLVLQLHRSLGRHCDL